MAVVVTAVSGYDLGYVWSQQGGQKDVNGYYIEATDAEQPGWWFGPGLEHLELEQGSEVARDDYDAVYQQVNPRTGEKIGRAPGKFPTKQAHLARLLAAEPYATAERKIELEREAAAATRQAPSYTDTTISFSKSISLLGASIRANARQARAEGDDARAAYWDAQMDVFHRVLQDATRAGVEHVQTWAGVTRTGWHGTRVGDHEPGRYEAAELVASVWLQGLSRAGEPQAHAHVQWARMAFTRSDGMWRALDTMSLRNQLSAVRALVAAHVEAGLTREFGVGWVARPDGNGNEIRGVSQAQMDLFSSRTKDIEEATRELARVWEARNGRAPTEYELLHIQKRATMRTRDAKEHAGIDWDERAGEWSQTMLEELGERLVDIAPDVSGDGARISGPEGEPPSPEKQRQAIQDAIELVSAQKSSWSRADLLRVLQTVLPAEVSRMDPDLAVILLDDMADRALSEVTCLDAPEFPALPDSLRREIDGRSVYTRPGVTKYAARSTLDREAKLVADAQREVAPHLTREEAARELGTDAARLEEELHARASESRSLDSGLRLDQAAALAYVLSSPRVCEVLVGPAGSGKTRSAAEAVRVWPGPMVGTACAQNAANLLRAAGARVSENTTRLLNDIDTVAPGTLIWIDEGSMVSMEHLARIVAYAAENSCKVVLSGDPEQLAAVEGGGGMKLLTGRNQFVQLATPQRFTHEWERDASLRLRRGDATALDEYQSQGRIRGGDAEQVMTQASRAYVAERLADHDVILTAASWDISRELSRRIRSDLVHLGLVDSGRTVEISGGQQVSKNDRIICRKNDRLTGLTNGDILHVGEVTDAGLVVRRQLDNGELSEPLVYRDYGRAELSYCTTGHRAQGSTVHTGLTLVTGMETRQWLYSALTRGAERNDVFVRCEPRKADPEPQPRPAPELHRADVEEKFREGYETEAVPHTEREAIAVLSDVLERDGSEVSALQLREQNLSDADHLGILHAVWSDLIKNVHAGRFEGYLRDVLPPEFEEEKLGHTATWLWRTMAQAEACGLDAEEVIQSAVEGRSLEGVRDIASVVDARIRQRIGPMMPREPKTFADRTPELANPEVSRYTRELAEMMDGRVARLGEFTAQQQPAWLVNALGPCPEDPVDRLDYEQRASKLATYRELYQYEDPHEAFGPEPSWNSPDKRMHYAAAAIARTRVDAASVADRSDATLWHMRSTYEQITRQAPEHAGKALQDARTAAVDATRQRVREQAEAAVCRAQGQHEAAERHEAAIRVTSRAAEIHAGNEPVLEEQAKLREDWSKLTEGPRLLAVAADTELRHRNPEVPIEPLKSAEPEPVTADTDVEHLAERQDAHRQRQALMETERVPDEDMETEGELAWSGWASQDRQAVLQQPPPEIGPPEKIAEMEAGL